MENNNDQYVYICADCLESHDEQPNKCVSCNSKNVYSVPKDDEQYYKYGK